MEWSPGTAYAPLTQNAGFATVEFAAVKSRSDERMSRRLIDCFHSILLAISIAAMVPIPSLASDHRFDHGMVPVTDFPSSRPDECCPVNWSAIHSGAAACGFNVTGGTHDSAPLHRIALRSQIDTLPATVSPAQVSITTAIMALASVRVQQVTEPFAVVGPRLTPSSESMTEFLDWCNQLAQAETAGGPATIASAAIIESPDDQMLSIDRMLDQLADEEPVDADINHVEVRNYVESRKSIDGDSFISVARRNPLVGSSAMITTLRSGPYAGDLADNGMLESGQLKVWSILPTVTRPFCIRHSSRSFDADDLAFAAASSAKSILINDQANDYLAAIGNIDSMLAEARAAAPSGIQIASRQVQADKIVASASASFAVAKNIGAWIVQQDRAAKEMAWQRATTLLNRTSLAESVPTVSFHELGSRFANLAVAGQELASIAAAELAKALPSDGKPAAQEKAAAQVAAADADLDR
ncbi:hypothetical protein [Rubripirellula obstinata]|nr:hypothetical protein [Rubripirellula obstinata]